MYVMLDHFQNEESAYAFIEHIRWPDGPICPHCGRWRNIGALRGPTTRMGLYKCYECSKPFTVKLGTMLEGAHLPLHAWLRAVWLFTSQVRRPSIRDLASATGLTNKSAANMQARIERRLAGKDGWVRPVDTACRDEEHTERDATPVEPFLSPRLLAQRAFADLGLRLECDRSGHRFEELLALLLNSDEEELADDRSLDLRSTHFEIVAPAVEPGRGRRLC